MVAERAEIPVDKSSLRSVVITDGNAVLEMNDTQLDLKAGDSVFVPAQEGIIEIICSCEMLLSYV